MLRPRSFVLGVLALTTSALVAGCGGGDDDSGSAGAPSGCVTLAGGQCVTETFKNPARLEPDADGVYSVTLQPTEFTFRGQRHCGRGYNGQYPAPTIDTAAQKNGEARKVRVNLKNALSKSDYRSQSTGSCTCSDTVTKMSCEPHSGHSGDETCKCKTSEGETCHLFDFNVTNLHAHGSHVRPDFATGGGCSEKNGYRCRSCSGDGMKAEECFFADDVISRVKPGEGVQHRWDIDEDGTHHEGLDWYHPHIHGSTAIQVAGGATGAWIIRGPTDELPGIKNAKERLLFVTTPPIGLTPLKDGEPCDADHITINDFPVLGDTTEKQVTLVNGQEKPRMIMPPGQIERWRFIHGSFLDEVFLVLFYGKDADCNSLDLTREPVHLTQIARDGITMPKPPGGDEWPWAPQSLFMSPGYRIDAMLDGSKLQHGETLCLLSGRFLQEDTTGTTKDLVGITKAPTPEEILKAASNGTVVSIVNVTSAAGAPTETKMPDLEEVAKLAPSVNLGGEDVQTKCAASIAKKTNEVDQLAALWLLFANGESPDACGCPGHNINCKNFETTNRKTYAYDRVLKKGAVDHWRVVSGFDGHPFHIHINPYVVCPLPQDGPNAKGRIFEPPFAHFRDTYLVNLDRTLDALTEYRAFEGNYVYHCHKLTHEDEGMMELIHVCDPAKEDCDKLCADGPCKWNACAPGDDECLRALTATYCLFDPSKCGETAVRCKHCDEGQSCVPGSHCRASADWDGVTRCAPGCTKPEDCGPADTCGAEGQCVPAPCGPPCAPPTMCVHGACK